MAKFVYNNTTHLSISHTLFKFNYEYYLHILFKNKTNFYLKFYLLNKLTRKLKDTISIY